MDPSTSEKVPDIEAKPAYEYGQDTGQGEVSENLGETHVLR